MISKKKKMFLIILCVTILVVLIIGFGLYKSGFNFMHIEGSIDNMKTNCLESTLSDDGNVSSNASVPVSDEVGMASTPYKYSLTNNCKRDVEYFIVFNVMEGSNIDNVSKVKVYLSGDNLIGPMFINNLQEAQMVDGAGKDILKTYKLDEGTLSPGEKKSFELRTWIDYNVTKIEGTLINKIAVKQFEK